METLVFDNTNLEQWRCSDGICDFRKKDRGFFLIVTSRFFFHVEGRADHTYIILNRFVIALLS